MNQTFLHILWPRPLVCVVTAGGRLASGVMLALSLARGRDCVILARPAWDVAQLAPGLLQTQAWLAREHANARLVCMAPGEAEARALAGRGLEALVAHNCAFIDERIFYPEPGAAKRFDAVHNAQTKAFKRHELAYGVPNLALVTYAEQGAPVGVAELAARYRHLAYVNHSPETGHRMLDGAALRAVLSQARCGLMLSEVEGPNNASMEYFLCGLPLVTTPSLGGREAMYDPRHVTVVPPEAGAVEAAVAAYARSAPDPAEVRAAALARARPHRARLIAWLSDLAGEDLLPTASETLWLPQFHNKLRQAWRLETDAAGRTTASLAQGWQPPTL